MYDVFAGLISAISDYMYSCILIIMLLGVGLYFTFRGKLVQLRLLPESIRVVGEKPKGAKSVSAFQALMVSTASRVGIRTYARGRSYDPERYPSYPYVEPAQLWAQQQAPGAQALPEDQPLSSKELEEQALQAAQTPEEAPEAAEPAGLEVLEEDLDQQEEE